MSIDTVLDLIKKEEIVGVEKIYALGNRYSAISIFPNGRIYNYYNLENYELGGPFQSMEEAEKVLLNEGYQEVWIKPAEEEIITRSNNEFKYEITFYLERDVTNQDEAQKYLDNDDFTPYVLDKVSKKTRAKVKNVSYKLKSAYYGDVYITTNALLDEINEQEVKIALEEFQSNELNDGWVEQDFAINGKKVSEFKPFSPFSKLELKEKVE